MLVTVSGLVGNLLPPKVMERKIQNLKLYKTTNGSVRKPCCRKVYEISNIKKIDTFLVAAAIKCLERCTYSQNTIVQKCIHTSALDELYKQSYLSVDFLLTLKNANTLTTKITFTSIIESKTHMIKGA